MPHSAKLGLLLLLCGSTALPQRLISARAGTVDYSRGASFIDGQRVILFRNKLLVLKNGQTLQTRAGRIEVLLGEGVFLRMGDTSSIRMDENRYADTRVAIETGFALIEVARIAKDARLHITCGDLTTELKAPGQYRFDADPCGLRVYRGELSVDRDGGIQKAKVGQVFSFTGTPSLTRFDPKETDPVKTWADQRSRQRTQREKHLEEQRSMQAKRRSLMH
jgi:hypothetical protein